MKIIDISKHNGHIDYNIARHKVDGVMIRLSYGFRENEVYKVDELADRNIRMCHKLGIPWGIYHYSYAQKEDDARCEARGVLHLLKAYQKEGILPSLPIAYDMEDNRDLPRGDHGGANWEELTAMCRAFCEELEKEGYYAQIYASRSWFQQMGDLSAFDHWVAEWGVPKPTIPCNLWQYRSDGNGRAYGASNPRIDENLAFVDYPALIKGAGLNGWGKHRKPKEKPAPPASDTLQITIGKNRWFFDLQGNLIKGEKV